MKNTTPQATLGIILTVLSTLTLLTGSPADAAPIKEIPTRHFGFEVNATTRGNICTEKTGAVCQPGVKSGAAGGFKFPAGAAIGANGNLYIADDANNRIQELTPNGEFILAIGKNVNGAEGHTCTQAEAAKCQAAVEGSAPEEFSQPQDIAIDRSSHVIYVLDLANWRVQEFNETGEFILTFGKEVNKTTKGNICTHASGDTCGQGVQATEGVSEPEAFNWAQGPGDLLAVGGPEHLLYVGDEHRVQEFDPEGKLKHEIALTNLSTGLSQKVRALAVNETGDAYLTYAGITGSSTIHKFNTAGQEIITQCTALKTTCWPLSARPLQATLEPLVVTGLAVSTGDKLAVDTSERLNVNTEASEWGILLDGASARLTTSIAVSVAGRGGMAFDEKENLYLVGTLGQEVVAYEAVNVAELLAASPGCPLLVEHESNITFDCVLAGEVNPEGVVNTRIWFEWGPDHAKTPEQVICTNTCGSVLVPVSGEVEGVAPNAKFVFNMAGFDANVEPPEEALTSETEELLTPLAPPKVVTLATPAIKASSVLFSSQLNPENALTTYEFVYVPAASCAQIEGCAQALSTPAQQSRRYGPVRTVQEVSGLQPGTEYLYALTAESESDNGSEHLHEISEGRFTTSARPVPHATTGPVSSIGTTSAIISGTVEPDGEAATYLFELAAGGVEKPNYSIIASGPVQANETLASETASLSGLQPGVHYIYRISVQYGAGTAPGARAVGAPVEFGTQSIPGIEPPSAVKMVPIPSIKFPEAVATCKHGYRRQKNGKCVKLSVKMKKRGKKHSGSRKGVGKRKK